MLMEHTYEINFARDLITQPIVCELARRCPEIMFNIDDLSVSRHDARVRISIVGKPEALHRAEQYLQSTRTAVRSLGHRPFAGEIPSLSPRTTAAAPGEPSIHRKAWLTIVGPLRRFPLFWVLSRRFDLNFNIQQSAVAEPVSILCLTFWGAATEIDAAVRFLREQGVDVEYGETSSLA